MPDLERLSFNEALKALRDSGKVPLAILSYNVEQDALHLAILSSTDREEVNALLEKFGLRLKKS